jgi:hypothetical protein
VTDLNRNLTKLWARVMFGRIRPPRGRLTSGAGLRILITVIIWALLMAVLPAMCVGPTGPH